ncbi:MAG: FHA domain-containing protein [candidate division Zixibacteria bacterium]|nr:FHA domain-containing protein [candidate division Zixibacteria bacterium]
MPEIVVKFEDRIIERVVTEKKRIMIGRTPDNDICLDNRGVSRKHAQIEFNNNSAVIIDNESLNGTFVNNRKITEEVLKEGDSISIGKFTLLYHQDTPQEELKAASLEGTMVLKTKRHREMLVKDQKASDIITRAGTSVLLGRSDTEVGEFRLARDVTTIGKADFVDLKVKGFFVSGLQAKIVREAEGFMLMNLGRRGKTKVNGEEVIDRHMLKNDDLVQIGKSVFSYLDGSK